MAPLFHLSSATAIYKGHVAVPAVVVYYNSASTRAATPRAALSGHSVTHAVAKRFACDRSMKAADIQMWRHSFQAASGRLCGPAGGRQYLVTVHIGFFIAMICMPGSEFRVLFVSFLPAHSALVFSFPQVFPVKSVERKKMRAKSDQITRWYSSKSTPFWLCLDSCDPRLVLTP